ncbi:glycosyltransferase [Shewanella aestuarii]|uniref:Glycosyltransferase n=2 Tax=Shewanella aestuarii TaxID=1028752 RepID=A0A6G9QM25_9GAMM|nr:glycosyltransferase [Shewanella aestuarii]
MIYLKAAIESVLNQTSNSWKLILVDGNELPSNEVKSYIDSINNPNIHYVINSGDRSIAGNWNYCLQVVDTDLVTLLHDDDYLACNYVEEMHILSSQYPDAAAFFSNVKTINSQGKTCLTVADFVKTLFRPNKVHLDLFGDNGLASLLLANHIFCPTLCYRFSKLPEGLFDTRWKMVVDFDLYWRILKEGHHLIGTSHKLYVYRRHAENQTSKLTQSMVRFEEERDLYNEISCSIDPIKWPKAVKAANSKLMIKLHVMFKLLTSIFTLDFVYAKSLFKFFLLMWR